MSEFKIKRFCEAGKKNANGYIFEVESTNKCIADFLGEDLIYVENKYDSNGFALSKPIEKIGKLSGFDNEYIYCDNLKEEYKDKIDDLVAGLIVNVEADENFKFYDGTDAVKVIPNKLIGIRVWDKNKKDVTIN